MCGNKINRRTFISGSIATGFSGALLAPVELLASEIVRGLISQAQKETAGALGSRNYVNLLLATAPSRYTFDHWLRTNPMDPVMSFNPMVGTALESSGGNATAAKYQTFLYKNLLVPHMFSHSVFNGKGVLRPLTDLLDNMLVIRGYGTDMDGHPTNATSQMAPLGGASSISGLAADHSLKTFQAIQWPNRSTYGNYTSVTGKGMNKLGTDKPLHDLLAAFVPNVAAQENVTKILERNTTAFDTARTALQTYVNSGSAGHQVLNQNMASALTLLKKGINDLDSYWAEALPRYQNLITKSMQAIGLPGLSDMNLVSDGSANWNFHVSAGNRALNPTGDLRSALAARTLPNFIAEGFALTEYVLKQGLTTSIELYTDHQGSMILNEIAANGVAHTLINDMHETGSIAGVILTSSYYRGIAAAILELSDQLKATVVNGKDLWSETVFQITSDFGRSGRMTGAGSDHGFNQMITSVYSGIIKTPMVVGNIYRSTKTFVYGNAGYAGTQGLRAPIDNYNRGALPTPVMAASTVANLLRIKGNPFENVAPPLVKEIGGQAVPVVSGKIVEDPA